MAGVIPNNTNSDLVLTLVSGLQSDARLANDYYNNNTEFWLTENHIYSYHDDFIKSLTHHIPPLSIAEN